MYDPTLSASVSTYLVLSLFCLSLHNLPVSLFSFCLVKPHYQTTFNSSLFSLTHTSISLCTLNLCMWFFLCRLPPSADHPWDFQWWHMVVYSAENAVYSACVLLPEWRGDTETVFILWADNPATFFFFIWVIVNLELCWKEETHTWNKTIVPPPSQKNKHNTF